MMRKIKEFFRLVFTKSGREEQRRSSEQKKECEPFRPQAEEAVLLCNISEFDNNWNKIALEYARPTLSRDAPPPDADLVRECASRIKGLNLAGFRMLCMQYPEIAKMNI